MSNNPAGVSSGTEQQGELQKQLGAWAGLGVGEEDVPIAASLRSVATVPAVGSNHVRRRTHGG